MLIEALRWLEVGDLRVIKRALAKPKLHLEAARSILKVGVVGGHHRHCRSAKRMRVEVALLDNLSRLLSQNTALKVSGAHKLTFDLQSNSYFSVA